MLDCFFEIPNRLLFMISEKPSWKGILAAVGVVVLACVFQLNRAHATDPVSFRNLKVGQTIEIKGKPSDSKTIGATGIRIRQKYKLEGQIQAIDGQTNSLTILGIKLFADQKSSIEYFEGMPIEFSALRVGKIAEVSGNLMPEGAFYAKKIKLRLNEYTLKGVIQAVNVEAMSLVIMGVQNVAAFDSEIKDLEGNAIDFSELRVGQFVKIKGNVRPDGLIQAKRVSLRKTDSTSEIEAAVQAIDKDTRTLTVMGVPVRVDQSTKIEFR